VLSIVGLASVFPRFLAAISIIALGAALLSRVEVGIITYGATVQSIKVPDSNGRLGDVALGFDNLADYLKDNNPYFGALIGQTSRTCYPL
jgi:galactose mutarotase-like enzyme